LSVSSRQIVAPHVQDADFSRLATWQETCFGKWVKLMNSLLDSDTHQALIPLGGNVFAPLRVAHMGDDEFLFFMDVSRRDPIFEGHYPHAKVFPGALLLECMVKAVRVFGSFRLDTRLSLAEVESVRFHRPLVPGDQIRISGTVTAADHDRFVARLSVAKGNEVAAKAKLVFTGSSHARS
jgi:3-hydroxyacyl-[acyl-carrier-protein] dehydratase